MRRRDFLKFGSVAAITGTTGAAFAGLRSSDMGKNLAKANLAAADLSGRDLSGWCLAGADLRGANLSEAKLHRTDLRGAKMDGAKLFRAKLVGANLAGSTVAEADLRGAWLLYADLRGIDWSGAKLDLAFFQGADMTGADLRQIDLDCYHDKAFPYLMLPLMGEPRCPTILDEANLSGLHGEIFLDYASLCGAQLCGMQPNYGKAMRYGFTVDHTDLSGADMTGADLRPLKITAMSGFSARNTNFTKARLSSTPEDRETKEFLRDLQEKNSYGAIISQTEIEGVLYG